MALPKPTPTGVESPFDTDEIIVTKTDLKDRITYANDVFLRVARLTSKAAIGQPHSIIRHPDMPRCVFKLLWDTIEAGEEIFAYVLNLAANGDHYWVLAHVSPSFDGDGTVVGYHSMRRKPDPAQVAAIEPIYRMLLEEEGRPSSRKDGMLRSFESLQQMLEQKGVRYDEFVLSV
jgi:PAS domain S-box-containing protein